MVTQYGMSKRFGLMGLATIESKYLDRSASLNCADVTAAGIDEEVMELLKNSYEEAKRLLMENREILDDIAAHLIEKETITGDEFMKIYCDKKGIPVPPKKKDKDGAEEEQKESQNVDQNAEQNEEQNADQNQEDGQTSEMVETQSAGMVEVQNSEMEEVQSSGTAGV